ncbi:MAG: hypothetical protein GEU74_11400 [Nitriliruptorales bacterium]|nr:hypothetical protein [Nitriliruptorales bacterium]
MSGTQLRGAVGWQWLPAHARMVVVLGLMAALVRAAYAFFLEDGAFDIQKDLSTATIDTATDMGAYGSVKLSFTPTATRNVLCKNASGVHSADRAGVVTGKAVAQDRYQALR